jgi:uncharacterized SAM-binding protein YcdF (DUF218 family)
MNTREAITQLIFISEAPRHVDVAMVLGCLSLTSMNPAIELYHGGLAKNIIISGKGSGTRTEPEWRAFQQYGVEHGIPLHAMIVETEARNTRENFINSEALLSQEIGWSNIATMAIITHPIHARRARMTACRYFPSHVTLIMICPTDERAIKADTWWRTRFGQRMVLEELRRIGEYGARGQLADL